MTRRIFFGQNSIRYLYFKYKDSNYFIYSTFGLIIVICLILVFGLIIPQYNNYLSIRQQVKSKKQAINNINQNIDFIQTLDKNNLNSQFTLVTNALPPDKEFSLIINSLSTASIRAGVTLLDFNFTVGKIASTSAFQNNFSDDSENIIDGENTLEEGIRDFNLENSINTTIVISGSFSGMGNFLEEISQSFPISELISMDKQRNSATINLKFHYKPYPKVLFNEIELIKPLSQDELQVLNKISSWRGINTNQNQDFDLNDQTLPLFD